MKESEIKISEYRYLELKESENLVPKLLRALLREIITDLKKQYAFRTEEDRSIFGEHLFKRYLAYNFGIEIGFTNSYNCVVMFRYNGEDYFVQVALINPGNGEVIPDPENT